MICGWRAVVSRTDFRESLPIKKYAGRGGVCGDNGSCTWSVNVIRNLNDWEIRDYEELLRMLSQFQINNELDQLLWKLNKNGDSL